VAGVIIGICARLGRKVRGERGQGVPSFVVRARVLKSPGAFPALCAQKYPFMLFKFLYRHKVYNPVPKEHELVAKTTINEKPLKRK